MKKTVLVLIAVTFVFLAVSAGSASAQCPCQLEGVEMAAENLENGAVLTVSAEDADVVTQVHELFAEHSWERMSEHVGEATVLPELTDNGFTVTVTSDDAETVTAIQTFVEEKASGEGCGHHGDGEHAGHGEHAEGTGGCPRHQAEPETAGDGGCGPDCNCGHHNADEETPTE